MTGIDGRQNQPDRIIPGIVVFVAFLLVPVFVPVMAWLHALIPLPVILFLVGSGQRQGLKIIKTAIVVAGAVALVTGNLPGLLFSCAMLPLGFYLAYAMAGKQSFVGTAAAGIAVLLAGWLVLAGAYGLLYQINPFAETVKAMDLAISATYGSYQEAAGGSRDTLADLEQAFTLMRQYVPVVIPSIFIISSIFAVWINMAAGNALLQKKDARLAPWPEFNQWRLPEQLVWLVIAGGTGMLLPASLIQHISLNVFLVLITVYFFQGLAVMVSLFGRWSIPRPFRIIFYAFILIQVYGFIFLAITGLADVWIDFRKDRTGARQRGA